MLRTGPAQFFLMFACAAVWGGLDLAPARAADALKCDKCVDSGDLDKKAISRKKIRPGAVNKSRLRDHAVTPEKWGFRAFDANDRVLGPLGMSGEVLMRVAGGPHDGKWFTVTVQLNGLVGGTVFYSQTECRGQAHRSAVNNLSRLELPVVAGLRLDPAFATDRIGDPMARAVFEPVGPDGFADLLMKASGVPLEALSASVGPDPALGADPGTGEPARLVALLPSNPGAPPLLNRPFQSRAFDDFTTGDVRCSNAAGVTIRAELLDVIDDPDLSTFTPPFRAGLK